MTKSPLAPYAALIAVFAFAFEAGPSAQAATDDSSIVKDAELSAELAAYGREHHDALALTLAAKMMKMAPGVHVDRKPINAKSTSPMRTNAMSADALLADARSDAGKDTALRALIDQVAAIQTKGTSGPKTNDGVVNTGAIDTYMIEFDASGNAEAGVMGGGNATLNLLVFDKGGNAVCQGAIPKMDKQYCSWQPQKSEVFRIEIRNLGNQTDEYTFATN